jgi:LAO/AO transport system kinase
MQKSKSYKPDWVPANGGNEFTSSVKKGVVPTNNSKARKFNKDFPELEEYITGVLRNNRTLLAKTITLIESNSPKHQQIAKEIIQKLLPHAGNSVRIGISGVPGAGKSTFIESLGIYLINNGYKVAVLTVDPSSSLSKGSILGDKTRMENLSKEPNCFIRPSPSGNTLGGVTAKTRETITVCEAAGFDVVLIETVGVGQNEIAVRSMVDLFLLMMIPGAGDELQGIKRGVIEISDIIVINKAEGENKIKAERAKIEYSNALHYMQSATAGWQTPVKLCSAINNTGITEIWQTVSDFINITKKNGEFNKRRQNQVLQWFNSLIEERLKTEFYNNNNIKTFLPILKNELLNNDIFVINAVDKLFAKYKNKL